MGDKSGIEWTEATWNPVVGCSILSAGCRGCYAMREAHRLATKLGIDKYAGTTTETKAGPVWNGAVRLHQPHLDQPLRWRRPRRIFVNSMSDLFHDALADEDIDKVFAVMALARHHTFQVLTKRSERMLAYLDQPRRRRAWEEVIRAMFGRESVSPPPVLPNVWVGVSVEDQAAADARIPDLLSAPVAVRWLSCEPLLGPVRLDCIEESVDTFEDCGGHPDPYWPSDTHDATWLDALRGRMDAEARAPDGSRRGDIDVGLRWDGGCIDWVVCGGESGSRARPMHPTWARSLRDQCAAAGVPFLFKQWGEWLGAADISSEQAESLELQGWDGYAGDEHNLTPMYRVGKKSAGRLLDGVLHDGYPDLV